MKIWLFKMSVKMEYIVLTINVETVELLPRTLFTEINVNFFSLIYPIYS